jgi:hypothetical protein
MHTVRDSGSRRNGTTLMAKWSRNIVETHLEAFVSTTNDLTEKSWRTYAAAHNGPSSGIVAKYMNAPTYSDLICSFAAATDHPGRSFTWPICPLGRKHGHADNHWRGSVKQRSEEQCDFCATVAAEQAAYTASLPTFAELYPELVEHLENAGDAASRGKFVSFRCNLCNTAGIKWAPGRGGVPTCKHCLASGGRPPGSVVARAGGGTTVGLEGKVAAELSELGFVADHEVGVVVPPGAYVVGVVKPDVVILDACVAVELDNNASELNRHHSADGASDDQLRDRLLAASGWKVLRVRRPDAPVVGDWPWRIETTSVAAKKLAGLVAAEVRGRS